MDSDSFIFSLKREVVYEDIAKDIEMEFDTSNYKVERPLPKEKKVTGLMQGGQGGKVMTKLVRLQDQKSIAI